MQTRILEIPLNKLIPSEANVRKTNRMLGVEELAANIAGRGGQIIQSLSVRPVRNDAGEETGVYRVPAGGRRLAALKLLAKRKVIAKTLPIPCIVSEDDEEELSLAENVMREPLHPADQFDAFKGLHDREQGAEEIGARFGVTAQVVRQRLRLAVVSPKLMALYREDAMPLDQLMAFTITDDHARQEAVWEALGWNREPSAIRRMLTQDRVRANDRRVGFVGLDAYLAAGGEVERDLFCEDGGGYLTDPALLDRLVLAGLEAVAEEQIGQGWKWAEASIELPPLHGFARVYPTQREFSPEEQETHDALTVEYDGLLETAEIEGGEGGERIEQIDAELAALEAKRRTYEPEAMARAGVFATLNRDGCVRLERGLVKSEDEPPEGGDQPEDSQPDKDRASEQSSASLSDKLVADLTAHRTAALADALGSAPEVALIALVHALALRTFRIDGATCLEVQVRRAPLTSYAAEIQDGMAWRQTEERHTRWAERLPRTSEDLWAALLAMGQDERLALLAHCVGLTVDVVQTTEGFTRKRAQSDLLAASLRLDMADYWSPTVGSYLGRVSKPRILEAVREGVSDEAAGRLEGLKKQPMAESAEGLLDGKRWLPAILRSPEPETGSAQG